MSFSTSAFTTSHGKWSTHYLMPLLLFLSIALYTEAQERRKIAGAIIDQQTKEPLPFASISLKKALMGATSNFKGTFSFYLPKAAENDTLVVSFVGYTPREFPINTLDDSTVIALTVNVQTLSEVVVRPKPPTHYIKLAVKKMKGNLPQEPFESTGFFSETILENKRFVEHNDAVFKTYYPAYRDSIIHQQQLLLHRKIDNIEEVAFMRKALEKEAKKARRKAQSDSVPVPKESLDFDQHTNLFSNPNITLILARMDRDQPFLDSNNFKSYHYRFGSSTLYDNRPVMVIHFEARKVVDHTRIGGTIFIDEKTDAIVSVDYSGNLKIPAYVRPILFALGYGVKQPGLRIQVHNKKMGDYWYLNRINAYLDLDITKRYLFSKNEHAQFEFTQLFLINEFQLNNAKPIAKPKRYQPDKEFEEQVFNDENLTWNTVEGWLK